MLQTAKVAVKFCAKNHAVWLAADQVPAAGQSRCGEDTQGQYFVFDLDSVGDWLKLQFHKLFVRFGGELFLQAIGAPMGGR